MSTVPPSFQPQSPTRTVPTARASSPSSELPWRAYLDIQLRDGPVTRHVIADKQIIIGRSPASQLVLDHDTVSRHHAELFLDPFGRFWVRDLGSTNGTLVNDEPIGEKVLAPSDWIQIGDYVLFFHIAPQRSVSMPPAPPTGRIATEEPTTVGTLPSLSAPTISAGHLWLLLDFSKRLAAVPAPRERLERLCELVVGPDFRGDMAVVARVSTGGETTYLAGPARRGDTRPQERRASDLPYLARNVIAKLRESADPVLASNEPSVDGRAPPGPAPSSIVACPLHRDSDTIELLYVTLPQDVGTSAWVSLLAMATQVYLQADIAWRARAHAEMHAAIARELEMAHEIQNAALPSTTEHPGMDVAYGFEPSHWVGGDYLDIVPMADGRVLLTVADVCGKGLQPAMVTRSLHTLVRATVDGGQGLAEMAAGLSRYLHNYLPEHSFVTMIAVAIDPKTGHIEHFNAGHPPALVAGRGGGTRQLAAEAHPAFGLVDDPIVLLHDKLGPDEVLLLYTDGVTELRNSARAMLGLDALLRGFAKICADDQPRSTRELAARLGQMLDQFSGGLRPEDDRAYLLARRLV